MTLKIILQFLYSSSEIIKVGLRKKSEIATKSESRESGVIYNIMALNDFFAGEIATKLLKMRINISRAPTSSSATSTTSSPPSRKSSTPASSFLHRASRNSTVSRRFSAPASSSPTSPLLQPLERLPQQEEEP
ncbi:hypothetical protein GYH30_053442 [Glycine max]|uniref:Uncharacterized protein n=2 Tax=Glycine subgen. Soja TaxID=1462606 RepID=A0A0R0EP76_SOYBN|nr:hypothetical protein GYH30_053442 [Glycine max]RZB48532.1 hypothetical protein D0Y65_051844 [Glycine soja]